MKNKGIDYKGLAVVLLVCVVAFGSLFVILDPAKREHRFAWATVDDSHYRARRSGGGQFSIRLTLDSGEEAQLKGLRYPMPRARDRLCIDVYLLTLGQPLVAEMVDSSYCSIGSALGPARRGTPNEPLSPAISLTDS
jgi:hypothetical protein